MRCVCCVRCTSDMALMQSISCAGKVYVECHSMHDSIPLTNMHSSIPLTSRQRRTRLLLLQEESSQPSLERCAHQSEAWCVCVCCVCCVLCVVCVCVRCVCVVLCVLCVLCVVCLCVVCVVYVLCVCCVCYVLCVLCVCCCCVCCVRSRGAFRNRQTQR